MKRLKNDGGLCGILFLAKTKHDSTKIQFSLTYIGELKKGIKKYDIIHLIIKFVLIFNHNLLK